MSYSVEIESHGFVKIPLLKEKELEKLSSLFVKVLSINVGCEFYYSLIDNDFQQNNFIHKNIKNIIESSINSAFPDYRVCNASILIKPASTKESLCFHQDWTFSESNTALTVWIPLSITSQVNGALCFLKDQTTNRHKYISQHYNTNRIPINEYSRDEYVTIATKLKEAIVFNPSFLHGSHPNLSKQNRVVISCNLIKRDESLIHVQKKDDNTAYIYTLEDDCILAELKEMSQGFAPKKYTKRKTITYKHNANF